MGKIAFVFPGQGSQYVGMAAEISEAYPEAKAVIDLANERLGYPLSQLMFEGPKETLTLTENAQPALVTAALACYTVLKNAGIQPDILGGNSLGEYAALAASGAMSFSDAIYLVRQRGLLMENAVPAGRGGMVALLGINAESVERLCARCGEYGIVEAANFNCPGQIVVSGEMAALEQVMALAKEYGAKRAMPLAVSGPFHCSMLKEAGEKLGQFMNDIAIADPKIPVIANYNADYVRTGEAVRLGLIAQVSHPVLWEQSVRRMLSDGVDTLVEIGAGKVLCGLGKKIEPKLKLYSVDDVQSLENTLEALGK